MITGLNRFLSEQEKEEYVRRSDAVFSASLADPTRDSDELDEAMTVLARAYRIVGNERAFFTTVLKDAISTPSAETCCELGEFYYQTGDYNEACIWFLNAASDETESILNIRSSKEIPYGRLADCYEKLGDNETAAIYREWYI